ncbi:ECF RNA polymerase sigma factor SigW [bioreactor metagenome]|uniref:ECF RNA polymerase sigma factor SigW n=1 Tax=bioreactor metagenome TaxID=1076179 RepID=A0A645FRS3_9ZZZZ
MVLSQRKNEDTITIALTTYSDMVYRICFLYLRNKSDIEDVFQEVFLRFLQKEPSFESKDHEKAWLIRVTMNQCKDVLKSFWRNNIHLVENVEVRLEDTPENDLLQVVLSLPKKYKDVIYLYYYEGYTVPAMAKLINQNENTIYSHLYRGKALLRRKLEGKEYEYGF